MKGVDTNLLIRYLTYDDPVQSPKAAAWIERHVTENSPGYVNLVTIAEVVWVLRSVYDLTAVEIAAIVERILQIESLVIQNQQQVHFAMYQLKAGSGSFADALIGAVNQWAGCESTLTFDKKSLRLGGFELA